MLTNQVPGRPAGPTVKARRHRRGRRWLIAVLAIALAAFCAATARLFVFPAQGMPARVDAIVMLGGRGDRYSEALRLARQHRAPYLAISLGSPASGPGSHDGHGPRCALPAAGMKEICFAPDPATTQGEAEYARRLAARYHWHSIVLVTITPQDTRARIRFGRCFSGRLYVMTGSLHLYAWPYEIAYEWAATIKALTLQRAC